MFTASVCDIPGSRATMTTSPRAVSLPGARLKMMLPERPDSRPWYSPVHLPTSAWTSACAPVTGTGDGVDAQAHRSDRVVMNAGFMCFLLPSYFNDSRGRGLCREGKDDSCQSMP